MLNAGCLEATPGLSCLILEAHDLNHFLLDRIMMLLGSIGIALRATPALSVHMII